MPPTATTTTTTTLRTVRPSAPAVTKRQEIEPREATVEDLYRVDGKAELVHGKIVHLMATGDLPSQAAFLIAMSLHALARVEGYGLAVPDNAAFVVNLPHRKSFSPDAAFHIGERTGMRFYQGAPLFAVEVRSEGDHGPQAERAMAEKRADYFAAGTLVVWDVQVQDGPVVWKYSADAPDRPTRFAPGDVADAEPAVPGWTLAVDELVPPPCGA